MRRTTAAALAVLLLLAGCGTPPEQESAEPDLPPAPAAAPPLPAPSLPGPPSGPSFVKAFGGVRIQGVRESYLWHAGGQRLAVTTNSGLWSVRPDGSDAILLASPAVPPLLVGPFSDGVIYLEQHPGVLAAYLARPGEAPLEVAFLEHGSTLERYPIWAEVWRDELLLALEGRRLISVNLQSGQVRELGEESVPVAMGDLAFSATGGVLALKLANRGDALRLIRLTDGQTLRPSGEQHVAGIAWSPPGDRWAVRAAEAGAPVPTGVGADLVEGATHIDVGDQAGNQLHLLPPEPLELVAGPWWSPDSAWLAAVAGSAEEDEAARELWVVNLPDEAWQSLGPLPDDAFVTGFHPTEAALMVHGGQGLALWPVSGDLPEPVAIPWGAEAFAPALAGSPAPPGPLALPDGSLLYLSPSRVSLFLQRPGTDPRLVLAQPSQKGALTVSGSHAALVTYREGPFHDLLVLPLPK